MENHPKHIHAELMAHYAEDGMRTNKPWQLWEFKQIVDVDQTWSDWTGCKCSPEWCEY